MGGNLTGRVTSGECAHAGGDEGAAEGEATEDSQIHRQTPGPGAAQALTGEVQSGDDAGGATARVSFQWSRSRSRLVRYANESSFSLTARFSFLSILPFSDSGVYSSHFYLIFVFLQRVGALW